MSSTSKSSDFKGPYHELSFCCFWYSTVFIKISPIIMHFLYIFDNNVLFVCTARRTCCLLVLLDKLVVYWYCWTNLLFIGTAGQTCCLLVLLDKLVVYLYGCTNLLFTCTVVQTCCLFVRLYKVVVYLYGCI